MLVPVGCEPVAHDLLVEAVGALAGAVADEVPVPAAVAGEHLVGEHEQPVVVGAELELRVRDDDPALLGDRRCLPEDLERHRPELLCRLLAHELGRALEGDVLVVLALRRLERGREDRLGQLVALAEPGGQGDAADRAGFLVLEPIRCRRGSRARRTRSGTCRACATSMLRPAYSGGTVVRARRCAALLDRRWFGMPLSCPNHHSESRVSSSPLPGMPGSSTWSNALTRSLATTSTRPGRSGCSYRSRTLPE